MGLTGLSTCSAEMTDPFCVGGGRRIPGSSKSGSGKDSSRNEVRLPVLHDPPKPGKRGQAKINSRRAWAASAGCGRLPRHPAPEFLARPPGLLRAFPCWGQPRSLILVLTDHRLLPPLPQCGADGTHSRPDQAPGWQCEAARSAASKPGHIVCHRDAGGPGWADGA